MAAAVTGLHPILQALLATLGTWLLTALGAACVFTTKTVDRRFHTVMLGFAAGVMVAASFWSLLAPAIQMAGSMGIPSWLPAVTGFALGGVFLWGIDRTLPHLHLGLPMEESEGIRTTWRRSVLLVLAVSLHNIPEGLAVGVAFGAVGAGLPSATMAGAVALAIGIGLQNFPEGVAVSMPLRGEGLSRWKSFFYGQLSGLVEPAAGILGAAAVLAVRSLLPYALGFAAGAMFFVVVEQLIPESQRGEGTDLATLGAMSGFALMMLLEVGLS